MKHDEQSGQHLNIRTFVVTAILLFAPCAVEARKLHYGAWQPLKSHDGIDFRLAYSRYDKELASKGTPAHQWCVQFRNRYQTTVTFSWAVTDLSAPKPGRGWNRWTVKPGQEYQYCAHYTNTPEHGKVSVWTDQFEFESQAKKQERTPQQKQPKGERLTEGEILTEWSYTNNYHMDRGEPDKKFIGKATYANGVIYLTHNPHSDKSDLRHESFNVNELTGVSLNCLLEREGLFLCNVRFESGSGGKNSFNLDFPDASLDAAVKKADGVIAKVRSINPRIELTDRYVTRRRHESDWSGPSD